MKARQKVKRKAAAKDRVFGCDLVEHLQLSGQDVPQVLKSCTEFVEHHGIVDGIYRLSGISSNIQKLRLEFDAERSPDLNKDVYLQDIHCVSSLCKAYFRELPNPLLTYQLYDKFADAVAIQMEEGRLEKIKEVLKELPSPHYRTLEFLMKHLVHMASHSAQTNMHVRNLAIVWAPNLLRSKDIELSGFNGTAAFMEVRIQSIVVEFILTHVEQIFRNAPLRGESSWALSGAGLPPPAPPRPPQLSDLLGDGPPQIRPYHTIIELADSKRKGSIKAKKWKSIFNLGRSSNDSRRKSHKPEDKGERLTVPQRPAPLVQGASRSTGSHAPRTKAGTWDHSLHSSPPRCSPSRNICVEDVHGESEGEATAKSEPTTPKVSRSSLVGVAPQGRSPKATHNRAEKCAGVHISGPFSVTVPFHITSNLSLSRLTRGQECPALSHFSGEKEAPETAGATDKPSSEQKEAEMRPVPAAALDKEGLAKEETRISLEVQHTFSFLDCQDAWLGDSLDENQPCKGSDVGPESVDCSVGSLSLMDDDMGSGFMNELIGDGMQVSPMATPQVAEPQFQFVRRFVGKASSGAAPPDAPSPDSCIDPISMAAASPDSRPESLLQKPRHAPPTDQRDALRHGLCDGSVHMRLTSSSIKVQHVKSFPVVPPKPQFAKIPPPSTPQLPPAALPEKGVGEAGGAAPQKQRWVSWRNGGSMSFDEAVALAKERHVAQAPVRRMQTYCYGDSEALPGPPGTERPPAQPKPALRLLGQRPLRPLSCLAVAEGPASGKPLAAQAPAETSPDGRRPPSQEEPSIPADPQPRSRTGLSRVGRCPAMTEESSHSSPQERR
uniref:Rho-GAP domain-containing protein n=1 Tax=Varanus komodoensis TaxID=61221 RepID=A0A8D2J108_VARKO